MKTPLSREAVAAIEVGHTDISKRLQWLLAVVFVVFIAAVPILELGLRQIQAQATTLPTNNESIANTNQGDLSPSKLIPTVETIKQLEQNVDDASVFRRLLLAPTQSLLNPLGLGNEQVYLGKGDWLFYRDAVDHVSGPGFLNNRQLQKRMRAEAVLQANPVTAIVDFQQQLARRNIHLIVMPVPGKVSIYPEQLTSALADADKPVSNASYNAFIAQLQQAEIDVFDPTPLLWLAKDRDEALYLQTDSHWTPWGLELAAGALAGKIAGTTTLSTTDQFANGQSFQSVSNRGDIAVMLHESRQQATESVDILPTDNALHSDAQVLLLGDSFSNIYSLVGMGWGSDAGLAERLAVNLHAPVDKIAVNGEGAYQSRQVLSQLLRRGQDRLADKKIVVLQFAARELSHGNWKVLPMQLREAPQLTQDFREPQTITATITELSPLPQPGQVPYRQAITAMRLDNIRSDHDNFAKDILVFHWGMVDNALTRVSRYQIGDDISIEVVPWSTVSDRYASYRRIELNNPAVFDLPVYWSVDNTVSLPTESEPQPVGGQPSEVELTATPSNDNPTLQTFIDRAERTNQTVIRGQNGWLFFLPELRFLSAGQFWGGDAARASRAANKDYADPLPAIVDFHQQLDREGIQLILVPVPAKLSLHHQELLANDLAIDQPVQDFIALLQEQGIAVVNLNNELRKLADTGTAPYLQQDTHWSPAAIEASAELIARRMAENNLQFDIAARAFTTRDVSLEINGDLNRQLEQPLSQETVIINQVIDTNTGLPFSPWRESPVLLMGDSHALVFHAGGDLFATGAGLPDQLVKALGFPVDLVAVRGSGSASTRMSLLRRRDNLAGKRVVIWCFTVREFTESTAGWPLIPVIRR